MEAFKSVFENRIAQFFVGGVVICWGLAQLAESVLVRMVG